MSLADNIHRLTREHLTQMNGGLVSMPSLLVQLDAAVTAETRAGSHGGGGKGLPIGSGALSLLQDITRAARDEQQQRTGTGIGQVGVIIQSWVDERDTEMIAYLEHVTLDWIDQIRAIINPTKPPWRPAVPCPSCGVIYDRNGNGPGMRVHCWAEDEGLRPPGEWTAECIHCGAGWTAENISWLSRVLEVA